MWSFHTHAIHRCSITDGNETKLHMVRQVTLGMKYTHLMSTKKEIEISCYWHLSREIQVYHQCSDRYMEHGDSNKGKKIYKR